MDEERKALRELVDAVWQEATENTEWPSTDWDDKIIDKWKAAQPVPDAGEDDEARFEDYDKYLNAPCPKCGASLLTEADLAATKTMAAAANWVNQLIGDVPGDDRLHVAIEMDGSGVPKPRILKDHPTRDRDNANG